MECKFFVGCIKHNSINMSVERLKDLKEGMLQKDETNLIKLQCAINELKMFK